jgi:hypothetical protein
MSVRDPSAIRWEEANERGGRWGVCPACRRSRALRLAWHWTNGAPGEFRQDEFNVPVGFIQARDGDWHQSLRYRDRVGAWADGAARNLRRALRAGPAQLRGLAETILLGPPEATVSLGAHIEPGAVIVCPRDHGGHGSVRVRLTEPRLAHDQTERGIVVPLNPD